MSAVTAIFSLPARYFYANLLHMQAEVCKDPSTFAEGIHLPGGVLLCGHEASCAYLCENSWSFVETVNTVLHTSHVESLFIFVLLPIYVFIFSVAWVESEHQDLEKRYLKGMGRSRAAIREVSKFKVMLENMMKMGDVWSRFVSRFKAWNPSGVGDPDLSAKRSLIAESAKDAEYENKAFEYVVNQITATASPQTVAENMLVYGIRVDPAIPENEESKSEETSSCQGLRETYESMKADNNLGGGSDKNFACAVTVGCKSEMAWNQWKKWLFEDGTASGYKDQLNYIFKTQLAADSGLGCHLKRSVVVGDQAVPKGFSLTHIRTTNPEDNSPFVIDVAYGLTMDKLKKEVDVMEKMLCSPTEFETSKVKLKDRLSDGENEIAVRFVLSEQYWSNMKSSGTSDYSDLLPNDAKDKGTFADFVGHMLEPLVEKAKDTSDTDCEGSDMTMSYLTLIMGEDDPVKSLLASLKIVAVRVWVAVLCTLFMLIPPLFRVTIQGGEFFPHPFATSLSLNMCCSAFALWFFLNNFQIVTERLAHVSNALAGFEQRTIDPSGKAAKAAAAAGGSKSVKDKKKEKEQEESGEASAFDLTVCEGQGIPYDPADSYWVDQWREKQDNVTNWHLCAGYLRVFVSSSRLTAQAILLAAGFILVFVLVLSVVQAVQGKGVAAVDVNAVAGQAQDMAQNRLLGPGLDAARRLSISLAKESFTTGLGDSPGGVASLSTALEVLRQQMQPFREAVYTHRRLEAEDRELKVADMMGHLDASKVTKTQFLTIAMVLLLIFYSIPLLWNIAKINDCFERHGNLLLAQKELHRMNMAKREKALQKQAAAAEAAAEEAAWSGHQGGVEGAVEEEAGGEGGSPPAEGGSGGKDVNCRRYEKIVDMAIQTASKNKSRFPLKLFGFVINVTLLTTWIALAVSPLAKQAQQMAPHLVAAGCHWLEHSDLVQQAEAFGDSAVGALDKLGNKGHPGKKAKHFNMKKLVKEMVCKNLIKYTKEQAKNMRKQLEDGRRLAAPPALGPVLKTWWRTHPGDPYTKFVAVTQLLHDLEQEMSQPSLTLSVEAVIPAAEQKMITSGANDLPIRMSRHGLPDSIKSKLQLEAVDSVAKLAMLSDDDVNLLCQGEKLGDKAAVKLLVKEARHTNANAYDEL